jgi:tetratricopeptide (TPR) repeat protein
MPSNTEINAQLDEHGWGGKLFAGLIATFIAIVCLHQGNYSCGQVADSPPAPESLSILQGVLRDSYQRPVAGVLVSLQSKHGTLNTRTDASGAYRFSALHEGIYSVRAQTPDHAVAAIDGIVLGKNESKAVDLTLTRQPAPTRNSSATQPEFFDEPHFTVAGVTDTTSLGGHGSSVTIMRNRDSLVKAATSLNAKPPTGPDAASRDSATEMSLRQTLEKSPEDFQANFQLGKLLVDDGKASEGITYLTRASRLRPDNYENVFELAQAHFNSGDYATARTEIESLLKPGELRQQAEPRHLLGEVDEKLGDALGSVREFQRAAELNPSEANLFDWGSELLLHGAAEPAVEVFTKGSHLFPQSVRMLTALGTAWYASGSYENAARYLCQASDLDPSDSEPYFFMGKIQSLDAVESADVAKRLERFASLKPENALANYYYAISLLKRRTSTDEPATSRQVKSLLMKSVQLDPKLGQGYLQLGTIYAEEKDLSKAIAAYQQAIAADPELEQAHYRLAQAYRQAGEPLKAQSELQLYEKESKQAAEETARERRETKQFVYQLEKLEATPKAK